MKRRTIIAMHRWLGAIAAVFLLSVSVTGLALNHSEWLGLDQRSVRMPFILDQYGMSSSGDILALALGNGATVAHLGGRIYFQGQPLAEGRELVGAIESEELAVVVSRDSMILTTPAGELIERYGPSALPFAEITAVAEAPGGQAILVADGEAWAADEAWLDFTPYTGEYTVRPFAAVVLPEDEAQRILDQYQGAGVPLYRVMLDLHSGRLFGVPGRTLMDLSAVAVLVLIVSGLTGWARKPGRRKEAPAA